MLAIAITTFHTLEGPMIHFFVADGVIDESLKTTVSSMLNLDADSDYFLLRSSGLTSYNYQFTIKSMLARGREEMLMLSLITDDFPTKKMEKHFLKEAKEFISFMKREQYCELAFHLERECSDQEYKVLEHLFDVIPGELGAMLERVKKVVPARKKTAKKH